MGQREKLRMFLEATEKMKIEIFALKCKIEGVAAEVQSNVDRPNDRLANLTNFAEALEEMRFNVTENEMNILIPKKMFGIEMSAADFNVHDVMKVTLNLRKNIQLFESGLLPSEETSCTDIGMAGDLLNAIVDFEEAFLNYTE